MKGGNWFVDFKAGNVNILYLEKIKYIIGNQEEKLIVYDNVENGYSR